MFQIQSRIRANLVSNLFNQDLLSWNINILRDLFDSESVCAILKISIPLSPIEDKLVWVADSKGLFSVKSALKLSMVHLESPIIDPCWSSLWKCKIHERLKMFLWRIGSEILPTNTALVAEWARGDPLCPLCHVENETLPHLFFYCQVLRLFWFGVCWVSDQKLFMWAMGLTLSILCSTPPCALALLLSLVEFPRILPLSSL
jgi:hypothetical protein